MNDPTGGSDDVNRAQPGAGARGQGADPLREAEAALKALREAKDPDAQRNATDRLERALRKLKRQRPAADPDKQDE